MARYVLQHPGETWLFNYQADPKTLYQSFWHCQGRGDIEANLTDLGTDRDATGGDHCIIMQLEVTIASYSSAARGICTRTGSGEVRHLSIKELWIQEAYRKKEFQLVSVDTLLNWADIGTKAHTSERLTSLRLGEGQTKQALACLIEPNENTVQATEGMEKIAMHDLIQRIVTN